MKMAKSSGGDGKQPTQRGEEERNKKVTTVKQAAGLMSHNITPRKGKGEF